MWVVFFRDSFEFLLLEKRLKEYYRVQASVSNSINCSLKL